MLKHAKIHVKQMQQCTNMRTTLYNKCNTICNADFCNRSVSAFVPHLFRIFSCNVSAFPVLRIISACCPHIFWIISAFPVLHTFSAFVPQFVCTISGLFPYVRCSAFVPQFVRIISTLFPVFRTFSAFVPNLFSLFFYIINYFSPPLFSIVGAS
jgi:ABC-type polysaccharide/polyol phosphate export permease